MRHIVYTIILTLLFINACTHHENSEHIELAKKIIELNPDSALIIIEKVEPESLSPSAYYQYVLLKLKAMDKTTLQFNDSLLISQTLKYYKGKNDQHSLSDIYLLKAHAYFDEKDYPLAKEYLFKAIDIAEKIDYKINILSASFELGEIYEIENNYDKALSIYQKIYNSPNYMEDQNVVFSTTKRLADLYVLKGEMDSALYYYKYSYNLIPKNNKETQALVLKNIAINFFSAGKYQEAKEAIYESLMVVDSLDRRPTQYLVLSDIFRIENKMDSASLYNIEAAKLAREKKDWLAFNNTFEAYLYSIGHNDYEQDPISNYKLTRNFYKFPYARRTYVSRSSQNKILEYEKIRSRSRAKIIKNQYYVMAVSFLLVLTFIISYLLLKKKTNDLKNNYRLLKEKDELLISLRMSLDQKLELYKRLVCISISPTAKKYAQTLQELNKLIYQQDSIFEFNWDTFNEILNNVHDNYSVRLTMDFPDLTLKEVQLCSLLKADFNLQEIATLTNQSINTIYKRNSDIRKKIGLHTSGNITKFIDESLNCPIKN